MRYFAKRVGQAIVTIFAATSLTFVLYRLMPGGPIESLRQEYMSGERDFASGGAGRDAEEVDRLIELHTGIVPDQPLHIAYFDYMQGVILHQDFGISYYYGEPVFDILFRAMPWSIFVSVYGLLLGFAITIVLGAVMAFKEGGRFDKVMTVVIIILDSIPYYVAAVVMLAVLAFGLGWFPHSGRAYPDANPGFNLYFMQGVLHHGTLPILSGMIIGFGSGALAMRANSIRIMGSDFLRVAELRGLKDSRISIRYIGRNAVLPLYTGFMISLSSIFSSSVVMERIFTYPGVGWYTFDALIRSDYPLLMGAFIFFTVITVFCILVADLTYGLIDPRASTENKESY